MIFHEFQYLASFNVASVRRPRKSLTGRPGRISHRLLQRGLGPKTEEMTGNSPESGALGRLQCGLGPKTEEMTQDQQGTDTSFVLQCGLGPKTEEIR